MHTATPRFIATQRLLRQQADGSETIITIQIGTPFQADAGSWACAVEMDGVDGRYPDMVGVSSLQALCLAIGLVNQLLGHMLASDENLLHPEDRSPYDAAGLAALFGR